MRAAVARWAVWLLLSCVVVAQTPQQAELAERAEQWMKAGRYAEAVDAWAELSRSLPNNAGLLRNLGIAEHLAGRNRDAIEHLEAALAGDVSLAPAWMILGAAYLRTGQPAKAIAPLEKALEIDPGLADAMKMLAHAAGAAGRHELAARRFAQWADAAPSDPQAWYGLGRSYEALAQQSFDALDSTAPESASMIALVASIQETAGQLDAAKQLYAEALRRDPEFPGLHAALGRIWDAQGDREAATRERRYEPGRADTDCGLHPLVCDDLAGRRGEVLRRAKALAPPASLYWQARSYDALAAEAFTKLTSLPPSVESYTLLGGMERDRGRFNESIAHWKSALELRPGDPALEKELAATLHQNRDYEAALPLVEKLIALAPDSPELNYLRGHILLSTRRAGDAIAPLEKAAAAAPDFLPARSALGLAYAQTGEQGKAAPHLEAALPIDRDGSLHFRLGRVYQALGRAEEAKQALAKSQELREAAGPAAQ